MRVTLALLLFALPASAQQILVPKGDRFGDFRVEFKKDAIDRSSPKALAQSWGTVHAEEAVIADRFRVLFEQAHLAILQKHYSKALLEQQRKNYQGKIRDVRSLRCQVMAEKEGPN